jgi:hypothetical protein
LRKLKLTLKIPVLALVDSDPYGLKILSVYMKGSMNMSYDSSNLTTPGGACCHASCTLLRPLDASQLSAVVCLLEMVHACLPAPMRSKSHSAQTPNGWMLPSDMGPFAFNALSVPAHCRKSPARGTATPNLPHTTDIKWLGVRPSDLDRFNIPQQCRLAMTDEDIKTGKKLVSRAAGSMVQGLATAGRMERLCGQGCMLVLPGAEFCYRL